MVRTNYANAYKEVLIILDNLVKEDYDKIPKEYMEFIYYLDYLKNLEQQNYRKKKLKILNITTIER